MKFIHGWKPDLPDHRDFIYKLIAPAFLTLPDMVDLRSQCSPVEQQGQLGSCTAHALAGMIEFLELKQGKVFVKASRLFIYWNEREIENDTDKDNGAMIRDGMQSLNQDGVCDEEKWPYLVEDFAQQPDATCYLDAKTRRISSYHRLGSMRDMMFCLAEGYPFVFGISVYESFESKDAYLTGLISMPSQTDRLLGGHAMMCVGYEQAKKLFIVRNSWGDGWGEKGYCYIPFDYMDSLADDIWTVRY